LGILPVDTNIADLGLENKFGDEIVLTEGIVDNLRSSKSVAKGKA
jgi:hypothetical protein